MISLKFNILASYASQLYVTAVGIIMVPLCIRYMGIEAYGLVGFFSMLQAWFNLLDMGLTPTIARETARFQGGALDGLNYRQLVRALEGIFFGLAMLGGGVLFLGANTISSRWLNAMQLPIENLTESIQLMALTIALRWVCGLYRGIVSGAEQLVWLSGFNATIATLRFVCVLPVLVFLSVSPQAFFCFQLGVAVLEVACLARQAYRLLPASNGDRIAWSWGPLKPMLKFSLTIAFTSSVWVLVTQTDKLLLSKILPLADYGYFTAAVLVASGISMLGGPISSAVMPRMARLHAEGKSAELLELYRQATQMIVVIAIPSTLVLVFFPAQVLWTWSGNTELMHHAASVLRLYAAGYGVLAVGAFPFYLQYAKGDLRLHLVGSALFFGLLIPSVVWSTMHYGAVGAGWAWLISNTVYFLFWTPLVHHRFAPGLHASWLLKDILRLSVVPVTTVFFIAKWTLLENTRTIMFVELVITGGILVLLCYITANKVKII